MRAESFALPVRAELHAHAAIKKMLRDARVAEVIPLIVGRDCAAAPTCRGRRRQLGGSGRLPIFAIRPARDVVVRGESLKATISAYLCDRIASARNIEVLTNTEVTGLEGDGCLEAIALTNRTTGETQTIHTRWLFVCIGGAPRTEWVLEARRPG